MQRESRIAIREMLTYFLVFNIWPDLLRGKTLITLVDNIGVVYKIVKRFNQIGRHGLISARLTPEAQ